MATTQSTAPSTPRPDEQDPRNSLRHVLASEPAPSQEASTPVKSRASSVHRDDDDDATPNDPEGMALASKQGSQAETPMYTATTTTTRRNANGSVSSVYSGNKIRHLKKEDGVPLWRRDIQYDFLRYVFEDDK